MSGPPRKSPLPFAVVLTAIVGVSLPYFFGGSPAWLIASLLLGAIVTGTPLFALIGGLAMACFFFYTEDKKSLGDMLNLVERINELGDNDNLLAVPLFMLSGSVMARGEISKRLIDFSRAIIGFVPGGLAVSAVVACMLFAAISGSSPATVVAIGAMMAPTMIKQGYPERFSHGLLTSSGSLGILIPPSIPMIIYPLIYQPAGETSRLFASGIGPGLLIGFLLATYCIYQGIRTNAARQPFSLATLREAAVDGFWSLMFPVIVLGGIYTGFFTVVEAAGISVVYAILVEVLIHRALTVRQIPKIVQETGVILGSLLVIMVSALAFSEFLLLEEVPDSAVEGITWLLDRIVGGMPDGLVAQLDAWGIDPRQVIFLIILNVLLLGVGTVMDILSAMFLFVPLLAPMAVAMGVDPLHFGIIFIVNLEIGYLTPPVGLNLFVGSTLFKKPLGHMVRSVAPFIGLMSIGLLVITYVDDISVGFGNWILGEDDTAPVTAPALDELPLDETLPDETPLDDGTATETPDVVDDGRVLTLDEIMALEAQQAAEEDGVEDDEDDEPFDPDALTPLERDHPDRPLTLDEMMEAAGD